MDSFIWDKRFETGLPEVDAQHQHLVGIINSFGRKLAENELVSSDLKTLLGNLHDYARFHFRTEEALMVRLRVDRRHMKQHNEEHESFLREIASMAADVTPENIDAAKPLLRFLTDWLVYHILGADQNMARQAACISGGQSAADAYDQEEQARHKATGPLLEALNRLFQQVASRNRALMDLNRTLEGKVAERTRELTRANARLEELALTDALTGLPNRRHAMQRLRELWDESGQSKEPLTCIMIDADGFKEVNDTYGHDAGDVVLRMLARELLHSMRNDDVVCRLGGDEFLIICPDTSHEGGLHAAEATRKAVSGMRVRAGKGRWRGSISVGVATRAPGMKGMDALIKSADEGVYRSKRAGRNRVSSGFDVAERRAGVGDRLGGDRPTRGSACAPPNVPVEA